MKSWVGLVVMVALVACSPAPSVVGQPPSPVAPSGAPSSANTPGPTGSPTTALEPWKVLATSDTAGAGWSPDGRWLLVWDAVTNGTAAQRHISLDDAHGNVVRTFQGELPVELQPVWLDDHTFVIARDGRNYLGTIDLSVLTPIPPPFPDGLISNGHGALAYQTSGNADAAARFVGWTFSGGTTAPRPGVPVAWSVDGTKLAIWHWVSGASGPAVLGWIEILGWPGLRSLGGVREPLGWIAAAFDASGRYVLANGKVLDLATGAISPMQLPGSSGSPRFDGANALRFPAAAAPLSGDQNAAESADGSTVVIWTIAGAESIALIRDGISRSIEVPGPIEPPTPQLSPDGSGLVVTCVAPNGRSEALFLTP